MLQKMINILGIGSFDAYRRGNRPLILVNGLAEQEESWYPNRFVWQKHFEVHLPGVLVYGGPVIQERLAEKRPINIEFLTNRLAEYLDRFVQSAPYNLVASSLGGQISVEYAARYPDKVDKIVLLCPSGFGTEERLPVLDGARAKNYKGLVESTFHDRRFASPRIVDYYAQKFAMKHWRKAFFETVRGTKSHSVVDKLKQIERPTLVICGREDRIVDPVAVHEAIRHLPNYKYVSIPNCGHAPQLECPRLINRMVVDFMNNDEVQPTAAMAGLGG